MIEAKDLSEFLQPDQEEPSEAIEPVESKNPMVPLDLNVPDTLGTTDIERQILEGILQNKTVAQIAQVVGLPQSSIRAYLSRKEVQEYLKELRDAINVNNQLILQDTLGKILQARISKIEEECDGDFSQLTDKDTLDVIKAFSDVTGSIEKNKKAEEQSDIFVQIYNQVM